MIEKQKPSWKKLLLGIAALLTALAGGAGVNEMLGSYNTTQPEITVFSTSTSANYVGVAFHNVNDYNTIGFTVDAVASSGTVRFACSMQDTMPTHAASSTSNRWDYVDVVDTSTEGSIDGYTGLVLATSTVVKQYSLRNAQWKWCTARYDGVQNVAGLGTTTVHLKRTVN